VLAGLLLLLAIISSFFRPTRALGVGYLSGLLLAVLTLVVLTLTK